jgi:ubiquinone/menaquinone biosynthesis C-methylase UbiE
MDQHELNKAIWAAGEWDEIATLIAAVGPKLLDVVPVGPGLQVLDVGTGAGSSIAIPAAQRGATVTGCDLTARNLEYARQRAAVAGVEVEWVEADAQDLPFPDDGFDRVFSTFGHMFAPDQAKAGAELFRVCRSGGRIGLATWTPLGHAGRLLDVIERHLPPQPGSRSSCAWGDPDEVSRLMPGIDFAFSTDEVVMTAPSVEVYAEFYLEKFGPLVVARQVLGDKWPALRTDIVAFYAEWNTATDGTLRIPIEYLVSVGTKP